MAQPNMQPAAKSDQSFWIYLSYIFGWILGLITLAVVKDDDRVRFHGAQAFVLNVALFLVMIVLMILSAITAITIVLPILISILMFLICGAYMVYVIILIVQVAQGKDPKVPYCGDFAMKNVMNWFK